MTIELFFAAIAIEFALAIPRSTPTVEAAAVDPDGARRGLLSHEQDVNLKRFMERVALSYVATPRIPEASAAANADPSRPTVSAHEGRR